MQENIDTCFLTWKPSMFGEGENHKHKSVEYSTIFFRMVIMEYCVIVEKERGEKTKYEIIREKGKELPTD